jgi:hypothetical protein
MHRLPNHVHCWWHSRRFVRTPMGVEASPAAQGVPVHQARPPLHEARAGASSLMLRRGKYASTGWRPMETWNLRHCGRGVPRRHHTAPALQQPVSRSNDRFLNLLVVLGLGVARLNREAREAQALHGTVSFVSAATKMDVRYVTGDVHLNLARTRSGRRLTLALSARRQRFSCCLSSETSTQKLSRQGT